MVLVRNAAHQLVFQQPALRQAAQPPTGILLAEPLVMMWIIRQPHGVTGSILQQEQHRHPGIYWVCQLLLLLIGG